MIKLKRAYDPVSKTDGRRFLVERLWPRGLTKAKLHVDAQHVAKPEILTHTLVHHLLVHATSSKIALARAYREILVVEFTPDADHFEAFSVIGVDEKVVFHVSRRPAT